MQFKNVMTTMLCLTLQNHLLFHKNRESYSAHENAVFTARSICRNNEYSAVPTEITCRFRITLRTNSNYFL